MNVENKMKVSVVLKGMPFDSPWEKIDPSTNTKFSGISEKVRATILPQNKDISPAALSEIEFTILQSKDYKPKKVGKEITQIWYENKEAFSKGEAHVEVDLVMIPVLNREGVIYNYNGRFYDMNVIKTSEKDKPLVDIVLQKENKR